MNEPVTEMMLAIQTMSLGSIRSTPYICPEIHRGKNAKFTFREVQVGGHVID